MLADRNLQGVSVNAERQEQGEKQKQTGHGGSLSGLQGLLAGLATFQGLALQDMPSK
ncbi:hypothetical protein PSEUDO8BK_60076 [Pseudomonas sp. 8BK]|nr:hypothetical protein PSEUDO8BK_60076 [Pseudomonas sp. 8BK]